MSNNLISVNFQGRNSFCETNLGDVKFAVSYNTPKNNDNFCDNQFRLSEGITISNFVMTFLSEKYDSLIIII